MSAVVCDSCVMQQFTESVILSQSRNVQGLIEYIAEQHSFAMDLGGKMQHQWIETCGKDVFGELLFQWLREGRIEYYSGKLHKKHKKHLMIKCGFPFTVRHEGVYICIAAEAFPHILVGGDLHFWEPKEKGCSSERRCELMEGSKGSVCKYLRTELEIQVVTVEQAILLLGVCIDQDTDPK